MPGPILSSKSTSAKLRLEEPATARRTTGEGIVEAAEKLASVELSSTFFIHQADNLIDNLIDRELA